MIRPLEPIELTDGELIEVIVFHPGEKMSSVTSPTQIFARIAALPPEVAPDNFSGQGYDRILYTAIAKLVSD